MSSDNPAIASFADALAVIDEQLEAINDDRAQSASVYVDAAIKLLRRPLPNYDENTISGFRESNNCRDGTARDCVAAQDG